ncbi:MAG: diguanylate cyclase domain-containing protein [Methyloligellaceae bacterium]
MQGAARVLIVGKDTKSDEDLVKALHTSGFETYAGSIEQSASEVSGQRRPDIVILNMDSPEAQQNPKAFVAMARTLKESALSSRMRVLMVGGSHQMSLEGVDKDIDDLLLGPIKTVQICHRVQSLIRLNTMHEELVRRLNTSAKYGVDAPPPVHPPTKLDNASILFMGNAQGYGAIENALYKRVTLISALTFTTAMDYLNRSSFDTILIDVGSEPENYLDFIRDLRRNSRFYNLPILMLTDPGCLGDPAIAYEAGVTDFIEKPVSQDELQVRTTSLVREQRFRTSLRQIYSEARHFATNDALTGLYSRGFMLEHLANVISDAKRTSQTFTVAAIEIRNMREINEILGYASGDRLIRQVGELIGLLVRGEDLATRYTGHGFIIILPDTVSDYAVQAIKRISGVVNHTEFAIQGHNHPVSVSLNTGITGFDIKDTPEDIIDRAWSLAKPA